MLLPASPLSHRKALYRGNSAHTPELSSRLQLVPKRQADILSQNIHFTPQTAAELRSRLCTEHRAPRRVVPWRGLFLGCGSILLPCAPALQSHAVPQILRFPFRIFTLCSAGNRSRVRIYTRAQAGLLGRAASPRNRLHNWVSHAHLQEQVAVNEF